MIFISSESRSKRLESNYSEESIEETFGTKNSSDNKQEVEDNPSSPLLDTIDSNFHPSRGEEDEEDVDIDRSDEEKVIVVWTAKS